MSQDVKPTRSELQKLKQRIKLANSGYNLLKKKRDGLIMDFFEVLKEAKTLRQDMTDEYIRIPGFKKSVRLKFENPYPDMF